MSAVPRTHDPDTRMMRVPDGEGGTVLATVTRTGTDAKPGTLVRYPGGRTTSVNGWFW